MGKAAEVGHGFETVDWIEGADEDSACFAGKMGGCVEAVVHAVDEVDIYVSGWAEEYCVAGSETAGCVGCRVDEAEVGFDLGDAGGEALAVEVAARVREALGSGDVYVTIDQKSRGGVTISASASSLTEDVERE